MEDLKLPDDLKNWLRNNENTKIDIGGKLEVNIVSFFSPQELNLSHFKLNSHEYFLNYGEFDYDPKLTYLIPGVDLIKEECDGNYSVEFQIPLNDEKHGDRCICLINK